MDEINLKSLLFCNAKMPLVAFSASSSTHKAFISWLFSSPKFFTILKCLAGRGNFRHETKRSCQPRIVLTKLKASMIEVSILS